MSRPVQIRGLIAIRGGCLGALLVVCLFALTPRSASAQIHGVPPSVTSMQFHVPPFLPNATPSVTSLGPYPVYNPSRYPQPYGIPRNLCPWGCRHRGSNGYNAGGYYSGGYAPIYAMPLYDYSDPGPYLSSGPPADQPDHVVVDLPPGRHAAESDDMAGYSLPRPADAEPLDATVLVFRDGHQQEVSNYAIMGQTVYVFDKRTQKIGLSDLDIPATIKVNDDHGVEFRLPLPATVTVPLPKLLPKGANSTAENSPQERLGESLPGNPVRSPQDTEK